MNYNIPVRVYYEDTDAGGVVYYANYLKYAERARTELLRSLGFENKSLRAEEGILLVVRRVEADYRASAVLDDLLDVHTLVTGLGNASFTMKQTMTRGDEKILFEAVVVIACIDTNGKPVRLPDDLKKALEGILR